MAVLAGVLFDFNGVLVDDEALHYAGFNRVLAPHGLGISPEAYAETYLGLDDRGAFETVYARAGRILPASQLATLIEEKARAYAADAARSLRVFPGATSLVTDVSAVAPVGIVSGALAREIDAALTQMGLTERVDFVIAAESVARCKPDPEGYLRGLAKLGGVSPQRVVAVEDSLAGIESALAAGLWVAAVAHSYPADQLRAAGAHRVMDNIAALKVSALQALVAHAQD